MPLMNALALLRSKIPSFPGYHDEEARRFSDGLVRSYLGRALALLQEQLAPDAAIQTRFEELILRAEFTNQAAFKAFEYAVLDQKRVDAIVACDAEMLAQADRAPEIGATAVSAYLTDVRAAFDARDRAMEDAAAA